MQLLVSVRNSEEAVAALAGGADIIDAKEPGAGALGTVSPDTFRAIAAAVGPSRLVSAAIGDADDEPGVVQRTRAFAWAGAAFVKVGFCGIADAARITSMLTAAVRAAGAVPADVVAVAYADYDQVRSASPRAIVEAAAAAGAAGVLLDTAGKSGGTVVQLLTPDELREWVAHVHARGMFAALGGGLTTQALAIVGPSGTDIVGVRGAACEGGRTGSVSAAKVQGLADALRVVTRR